MGFKEEIAKAVAAFYNYVPSRLRITIFNSTSLFIATASTVIVGRVTNLTVSDPILAAVVVLFVAIFSGVINELQSKLKDLGDKELAKEGNDKVLEVAKEKEAKASKLIATVKQAQK